MVTKADAVPIIICIFLVLSAFSKPSKDDMPDYSICEEECGDSRSCFDDCVFDINLNFTSPLQDERFFM